MSKIGKIPISIPKGAKINISADHVAIEGPKGKLNLDIPQGIEVKQEGEQIIVSRKENTIEGRTNHGTVHALLGNKLVGVDPTGHKKELEIQGIGFRAQQQGTKIIFNLGFSHPIEYEIPNDVKVSLPTPTSVVVEGIDNVIVGQVAAKIRAFKPVEPYKGKGVRYVGEFVRRKQGKSVTK